LRTESGHGLLFRLTTQAGFELRLELFEEATDRGRGLWIGHERSLASFASYEQTDLLGICVLAVLAASGAIFPVESDIHNLA
jgi:hypothetical protein